MQKVIFNVQKFLAVGFMLTIAGFVFAQPVSAHVTVKPGEAGVGSRQNFVVSVPTEEDVPTVGIRLLIPEGVKSVRPNVKPGWSIQILKTGEGDNAYVSEIIWTGGNIPAEQRDEFVFSGQVPAEETSLNWKAYQTYAGGKIVAWDKDAKTIEAYTKANPPKEGEHDDNAPKPFSVTKVVNDLKASPAPMVKKDSQTLVEGSREKSELPLILSISALIVAAVSMVLQFRKKLRV